jgi:carboxynorspermidine decarboxylase
MDIAQIPSPCYVLDKSLLSGNLELIRQVGDESGVEIILAFKGFAMWGIFPLIRPYITGVSASSTSEARLGYEQMEMLSHSYSPAYTDSDFESVLKYSSHITFNSLTQYGRFRQRVAGYGRRISVGLRVNPELSQIGTELYNPCAPGSRLGLAASGLNDLPEGVEGLHVHALCESSAEATKNLIEAVDAKFGCFLPRLKWLNLGGGHLMTRKGYNTKLLVETLKAFRCKYPHLHVILEPGAAFVWDTGVLLASIEDIVENDGEKTAILNVSFTAHMPDCLEMPYKPRIRGASDAQPGKTAWRLGGNSCLAGDYMGDWSFDDEPYIGKSVIFEDMMHYTMVKTTVFNGVPHPSIGVWDDKGFTLLRRFGYEDYKNRLS